MKASHLSDDCLVIGGGPSGSMLAALLANAGQRVTLLEKEREAHHKVCGEFLSREAVYYLLQAGIDALSLGAQGIDTVRLSSARAVATAPLPFQAFSLSRRTLDEALLARAAECGCRTIRGAAVESLTGCGEEWTAQLSDGRTVLAPAVFLATGKHDLRGWARPAGRQNDLIGFKLHWQLSRQQVHRLRRTMDLFLFPGGYGGLSLIENDHANLCLVVRRSALRVYGAWPQLLAALLAENRHLRALLHGAEPLWPRPLAISPVPYGHLADDQGALWRVGDQAAVIPSFTGDGISIALHSAVLAAKMFLDGDCASRFHGVLRAQLRGSMALATLLSRVAVTSAGGTAALRAARMSPRIMRSIAAATRIPERSLLGNDGYPAPQGKPQGNLTATSRAR